MPDWLVFLIAASTIVVAGSVLAVSADAISHQTRVGAVWFGSVAVAVVTSLPELVTDVAAVRSDSSSLALGDLFGSNMANMAILAGVTLVFSRRRLLQRAALEHVLTASLAIILSALAVMFISVGPTLTLAAVDAGPLVIALVYVLGILAVRERQAFASTDEGERMGRVMSLRAASALFVLSAGAIVVAGPFLADSSHALAEQTGLGDGLFGAAAVAAVTSLPELTVSITAIRVGALNMAIGNLIGSNGTNMALLLPLEIAYRRGDILQVAGPELQTAAAVSILLMAIGTSAIVLRAERSRLPFDLAAVLMLAVYVLGLWAVAAARTGPPPA
jgi:cation:H+ antiporter